MFFVKIENQSYILFCFSLFYGYFDVPEWLMLILISDMIVILKYDL